jgi:hypothetical protein
MAAHPVNTLQGIGSIASNPRQIPGMVANALADTARRGSSGALGFGEVVGENLSPGMFKGGPMMNDITVYHGSPHRINNVDEANPYGRFDTSKIGTGEGAQAYGHGMYLAESPDVARQYAGSLSAARATQPVGNVDLTQLYQSMPNDVPDNLLAARRDFRELQGMGELSAADRRDYLQAVQNNIVGGKGGNFYTVDLPDEHIAKMLDWDAPLSEQPEAVRKALQTATDEVGGPGYFQQWIDAGGSDWSELKVNMLDEALSPQGVSDLLRKHGIPGIKYFDGGSRTAKDGTRNFVIFDGDTAKILKRE